MCSGLQSPVFRIPRAKVSLNRESGFPYVERSKQKQFGGQGKSCYTVKRFLKIQIQVMLYLTPADDFPEQR